MRTAIYAGTFDPVTNGHLDVYHRARRLFDRVIMAIARNQEKDPLLTVEERLALIRVHLGPELATDVMGFDGLLVDFARQVGATALVRGMRAVSDFEFEFQMAQMNRHLSPELETIFLMPSHDYIFTSSRLVKQVARYGGDVSKFVPPLVAQELRRRFGSTSAGGH